MGEALVVIIECFLIHSNKNTTQKEPRFVGKIAKHHIFITCKKRMILQNHENDGPIFGPFGSVCWCQKTVVPIPCMGLNAPCNEYHRGCLWDHSQADHSKPNQLNFPSNVCSERNLAQGWPIGILMMGCNTPPSKKPGRLMVSPYLHTLGKVVALWQTGKAKPQLRTQTPVLGEELRVRFLEKYTPVIFDISQHRNQRWLTNNFSWGSDERH